VWSGAMLLRTDSFDGKSAGKTRNPIPQRHASQGRN
jgi:hypothetical protein